MELSSFKMKQKYTAYSHRMIFVFSFIIVPLIMLVGGMLLDDGEEIVFIGMAVLILLCGVIWFRPVLIAAFQRVFVSDNGVEVRIFSKTVASIRWRDCKSVLPCYAGTAGDLYNQYWICFSTVQVDTSQFSKGLRLLPKQSDEFIYMTRSEFAYALIKQNVNANVWKDYVRNLEREKKQYTQANIAASSNDEIVRQSPTLTMFGLLLVVLFGIVPFGNMLQKNSFSVMPEAVMMVSGFPMGMALMIRRWTTWFIMQDDGFILKTAFRKSTFFAYNEATCSPISSSRGIILKTNDRRILLTASSAEVLELLHRVLLSQTQT